LGPTYIAGEIIQGISVVFDFVVLYLNEIEIFVEGEL